MKRRIWMQGLGGVWALAAASVWAQVPAPAPCGDTWPEWAQVRERLMSPDGRIMDPKHPRQHTVSEGQAYGLFFALVGNDRGGFERLLQWTEGNLAGGDLTARLPAWQWGQRDDGSWGVIDPNPATDADLWIVYALAEAGRLWQVPRYSSLAALMAQRLLRERLVQLPGLGPTLLPGPQGFVLEGGRHRLNPSYLPLQQMRWLVRTYADPQWRAVYEAAQKIVLGSLPKGLAPDWVIHEPGKGLMPESQADKPGEGSYDAIRVYLWAALMHESDPQRRVLLARLAPMAKLVEQLGYPPESVNTLTGQPLRADNPGPSGFSAALLPFLKARGDAAALEAQQLRLEAKPVADQAYYEQMLRLFALGSLEGRFQFTLEGSLVPQWRERCVWPPSKP